MLEWYLWNQKCEAFIITGFRLEMFVRLLKEMLNLRTQHKFCYIKLGYCSALSISSSFWEKKL